jgi:predicted  nucleic acid-binding Zn-ribbon protein
MVNKCVRCGTVYDDLDDSIISGCPKCGSIFFLYIKTDKDATEFQRIEKELETKKTSLEKELERKTKFEVETIRMPKEGIYEINVDALMKKEPLILLAKGRTYFVYLPSVFEKFQKK